MNTYQKYYPNVYIAKCDSQHEKGDSIIVTTRNGKENECIVFNFLGEGSASYYYSIVRADGFNTQEWAKRRAERLQSYAMNADSKALGKLQESEKDRDFLSLGEPIKVGHHSEKKHRKAIEQAQKNMSAYMDLLDKSHSYAQRAEYWEKKAEKIDLSMPDSIEYFTFKIEEAEKYHADLKSGKIEKSHSFSLQYAKKEVNQAKKNLEIAKKLWG